jgi:hypothetical protein
MIDENFEVKISQQVEIHFVTIIPDRHHKRSLLVKKVYLFLQRKLPYIIDISHCFLSASSEAGFIHPGTIVECKTAEASAVKKL